MANPFRPLKTATGATLQAGIPFKTPSHGEHAAWLVRGVVMATYVYDDPQHPFIKDGTAAVYCDVLVYTQLTGGRTYLLKSVLVGVGFGGLQSGPVRRPKATSKSISGAPLDPTGIIDPATCDGDHVLVGFMDDRRHLPVIVTGIPHPNSDPGHLNDSPGHRMRLRLVDGSPHFSKHNGVVWGADDDGNLVLDASQGNTGSTTLNGVEVPGIPGDSGNVISRATLGAACKQQLMTPGPLGVAAVESALAATGFTLNFKALPAAISIIGAQGPIMAISGGGVGGAAAVALGANATMSLVDSVKLTAYLTLLITWLTQLAAKVPGGSAPPPPPLTDLANHSVKVPAG